MYAHIFKSPVGYIAIIWKDNVVVKIQLPFQNKKQLQKFLKQEFKNLIFTQKLPVFIIRLKTKIIKHLSGNFQKFNFQHLYIKDLSVFQLRVYQILQNNIAASHTITYKQLAQLIHKPKAYRAVAQALKNNPFPIIIPCHRVIGTSGLGGFNAPMGILMKILLLKIEKAL